MKNMLLFFLTLILGFVGFLVVRSMWKPKIIPTPTVIVPSPSPFSVERPPKESLVGSISALSGEVFWESRIATEGARITQVQPIQQGEQITTGTIGDADVTFPNAASIHLSRSSHLSVVQTLPEKFVFAQTMGMVTYQNLGNSPLSVRVLHLLVEQSSGIMTIQINEERPLVTLTVRKGSVKVAFNDLDYVSSVRVIDEGQTFYFNDKTRNIDVE